MEKKYPSETPSHIAERMVFLADIQTHHSVLEPCAGRGDLVEFIQAKRPRYIDAIELNKDLFSQLHTYDRVAGEYNSTDIRTMNKDFFLIQSPYPEYNRIIMNPPFHKGESFKFLNHALKFLKPGGRLISLVNFEEDEQIDDWPKYDLIMDWDISDEIGLPAGIILIQY